MTAYQYFMATGYERIVEAQNSTLEIVIDSLIERAYREAESLEAQRALVEAIEYFQAILDIRQEKG